MSSTLTATCQKSGSAVEVPPPNLPESGGALSLHDDPTSGWGVLDYVFGPRSEKRPWAWDCAHCGGTCPIWGNFCLPCHHARPDPLPYVVDGDLVWKEERGRKREAHAVAAEWDREHLG